MRANFVPTLLAATLLGALAQGCGPLDGTEEPQVVKVEGEIIGGATITKATRRSLGLVDYSIPGEGCSGVILSTDWMLTANHCVDWQTPANNTIKAVRADGGMDTRHGTTAVRAGIWDIAMVRMTPAPSTWPTVTRSLPTAAPSTLVGGVIDCYGMGASGYKQPSGLLNDGLWRTLEKDIETYDSVNNFLKFTAVGTPGRETVAFGDSGGGCFVNGQLVGTVKGGDFTCADPNNCLATITNISSGWIAALAPQASYLDEARGRSNASFMPIEALPPSGLENGWTNSSFNTNIAGFTLIGGTVYLRGALVNGNASPSPRMFTLPASVRPSAKVYVPTNLYAASKGRLVIDTDGSVLVEAETSFSDATRFTSLDGVSFERLTTGHSKLALQGGWVPATYGTRPPAISDTGSTIRFEGAMMNGTSSSPFMMPVGFRPSSVVYLPVDMCGAHKGRLVIDPSGATTLYAEKAWSDATCFTSFEGVSFAKTATSFTALEPLNGWATSPYATRAPAVNNIGGIVTFEGAISSSGTSTQAFVLRPSFRPATNVYIETDMCGATKGRIIITPAGNVSVNPIGGTFSNASCFTSLEGVTFGI